jgi:hypothetical protein
MDFLGNDVSQISKRRHGLVSLTPSFADQDDHSAAFFKGFFDDLMKVGAGFDGFHIKKYLITEPRFELIDQTPGIAGTIGSTVADEYPDFLASAQKGHIRLDPEWLIGKQET